MRRRLGSCASHNASLHRIELFERFHPRQSGFEHTPNNRVALAFINLGRKQRIEVPHRSMLLFDGFLSEPTELIANRWQPQLLAVLMNRFTAEALVRTHCITSVAPSS